MLTASPSQTAIKNSPEEFLSVFIVSVSVCACVEYVHYGEGCGCAWFLSNAA